MPLPVAARARLGRQHRGGFSRAVAGKARSYNAHRNTASHHTAHHVADTVRAHGTHRDADTIRVHGTRPRAPAGAALGRDQDSGFIPAVAGKARAYKARRDAGIPHNTHRLAHVGARRGRQAFIQGLLP